VNERYSGFKRFCRKKLNDDETMRLQECYRRLRNILMSKSATSELLAIREQKKILVLQFIIKAQCSGSI